MPPAQKRSSTLQFILLFMVLYFGIQLVMNRLMPAEPAVAPTPGPRIESARNFTIGHHPEAVIRNVAATSESHGMSGYVAFGWCSVTRFFGANAGDCAALKATHTGETYVLPSRCPDPPVEVFSVTGESVQKLEPAEDLVSECPGDLTVDPGTTSTVSLLPWKYAMFEKVGTYEIRLPEAETGTGALAAGTAARFTISEPSFITKIFRTFITEPFLNFLVFIASYTPGHDLGIAIIVLTLIVKLVLFFPTQHSLEGQKKMQLLQPKFEALKRKYKDDNAKLQEETMKLWKEYKINPFQSCLPIVIQFPILIGLFYVIRDGSHLEASRHLLYSVYQNLTWHFDTNFLWLDLLKADYVVMPAALVILQFLQLKLSFSIAKRKKKKETVGELVKEIKEAEEGDPVSQQDLQQKIMLWGLPIMIGVFAFQFPSAVALYWGVSTLFAIGQQIIVNREHLRV